jgi:hypothetical protein
VRSPLRQRRPGNDLCDLSWSYLYSYLNQTRSSRHLEARCRRIGHLYPDHKTIAEFRRMHLDAAVGAGAELVHFCTWLRIHSWGLDRHRWLKSSVLWPASTAFRERLISQHYLDSIEKLDQEATMKHRSVYRPDCWFLCLCVRPLYLRAISKLPLTRVCIVRRAVALNVAIAVASHPWLRLQK